MVMSPNCRGRPPLQLPLVAPDRITEGTGVRSGTGAWQDQQEEVVGQSSRSFLAGTGIPELDQLSRQDRSNRLDQLSRLETHTRQDQLSREDRSNRLDQLSRPDQLSKLDWN